MVRLLVPMILQFLQKPSFALLLLALFSGGWTPSQGLAEPPEYFARIIDEGNVTFKFYDPAGEPRTHPGYTTFQFDVHYRSTYQWQVDAASGRRLVVQPTIGQITYQLVNEVQLPEALNHDQRWTHPLVKHEFDHVAMTVDPRIRLLIEHVCRNTPRIVRDLPSGTQVTDSLLDRLIHEAVEPRYQSVLDVLAANENDLDKVTVHGRRILANRRDYFESLFTEPNLKQHGFPYLGEVKQLLREKSFREAKLPYLFDN